MTKVVHIDEFKSRKRHLDNQDVFEASSHLESIKEVNSGTKQSVHRISSGLTAPKTGIGSYHEFSKPRLDSAREILDKWKNENRLNLKMRKDLSQQIEIDDHGIRIGRTYWEFAYIFQDTLEKGEKYLKKFKLKVPTVNDVDSSALLLPGDCIEDKRINLLLLLGFPVDENTHCKLWTSTRQDFENTDDIALDTNIGEIVSIFKNRVKNFFGVNDNFFNLLYHYGTGIVYYEASQHEVGNICGIRKLKNT